MTIGVALGLHQTLNKSQPQENTWLLRGLLLSPTQMDVGTLQGGYARQKTWN